MLYQTFYFYYFCCLVGDMTFTPTIYWGHCSSERLRAPGHFGVCGRAGIPVQLSDTKSWSFFQEAPVHEACFWAASFHSQLYTVKLLCSGRENNILNTYYACISSIKHYGLASIRCLMIVEWIVEWMNERILCKFVRKGNLFVLNTVAGMR